MQTSQLAPARFARRVAVALIGAAVLTGAGYDTANRLDPDSTDAASYASVDDPTDTARDAVNDPAQNRDAVNDPAQNRDAVNDPAKDAARDAARGSENRPPHQRISVPWSSRRTGGLLDVAYDDGAGHTRTYRLICGAVAREGSGDGDPATACAHLDAIGGPAPDVARGQFCSMIYGGPQTARVTGTWRGRVVRESYRRTNGCEVERWNRMVPALPNPVADAARLEADPVPD